MKIITCIAALLFSFVLSTHAQDTIKSESGLKFVSIKEGKGTIHPKKGDKVKVKYTAHYSNGEQYESGSVTFVVDKPEVIKAWDEAIKMMTVGQKAMIVAPGDIAYGTKGVKIYEDDEEYYVPPNETLIFYMTLQSIK